MLELLLKKGANLILVGSIGSILTNSFNNKKQEKEFINKILCSQDKCLKEILGHMKFIESYFNPKTNPFGEGCFLQNRCKEFIAEKEDFKKEYYKTSKKVRKQIESFNQTFNYIAKSNMPKLKSLEIFNDEITYNYEKMVTINKSIRTNFKMD